jgi:hypothetical protein
MRPHGVNDPLWGPSIESRVRIDSGQGLFSLSRSGDDAHYGQHDLERPNQHRSRALDAVVGGRLAHMAAIAPEHDQVLPKLDVRDRTQAVTNRSLASLRGP